MIPGVNKISRKASIATINGAWGSGGCSEPLSGVLKSIFIERSILGFKEHLDWLKIDLNAAEVITAQDNKRKKNYCDGKLTYTMLKLRVKLVTYESKT